MVTGCMGTCAMGPVILVGAGGIFYTKDESRKGRGQVVARHLLRRMRMCEEFTYFNEEPGSPCPEDGGYSVLQGQVRMALRNCGHMEYASLEAYISRDGYGALARALWRR